MEASCQLHSHDIYTKGKEPPLPKKQEAGCVPEPARNIFGEETSPVPTGNQAPYHPAHTPGHHIYFCKHYPPPPPTDTHTFLITEIYFNLYNLNHHTNQNIFKFVKLNISAGCIVLVEKPEGKRPLVRRRRRWVDNIRMDLQEVGCRYMDWIGLAQHRDRWQTVVSAVMKLRVP